MAMYKSIQFLGWEVYSGPIYSSLGTGNFSKITAIDYAGFTNNKMDRRLNVYSQCVDIMGRVAFVKDAVEKAFEKADSSDDVLKVFMAPEFLFRGASGAYLHDLIGGWIGSSPVPLEPPFDKAWGGLVGELKKIIADPKFSNWLFVFGTAVSASLKTEVIGGKSVIQFNKPAEVYNTAIIQKGGSLDANRYVRKYGISHIDFINYRLATECYINGCIISPDLAVIIPNAANCSTEGSLIFTYNEIMRTNGKPLKFGLEICLDHYGYRYIETPRGTLKMLDRGRIKDSGLEVDIQLVPSGGMTLHENSMAVPMTRADYKSYLFNCDGLSCLAGNRYGAHIQIGENQMGKLVLLENLSTDFDSINHINTVALEQRAEIQGIGEINALNLWRARELSEFNESSLPYGSGQIYFSQVYPL